MFFVTISAVPKSNSDKVEPGSLHWKVGTARKYHRPPLNRKEVALRTGYADSTVGMFESGARMPTDAFVDRLADSLNVPKEWFYDGKETLPPDATPKSQQNQNTHTNGGNGNNTTNVQPAKRRQTPQINLVPYWGTVPAGDWEMPISDPALVQITESVDPEGVIAVRVTGRSMEPKFFHGDLVAIKLDNRPRDGVISLAANTNREMTLKLLKFVDGDGYHLVSLNPEFGEVSAEGWEILGFAIAREEVDPAGLRP